MKKLKKLNDSELSLVLSEQSVGRLIHTHFRMNECGCVGGAVEDVQPWACPDEVTARAREISRRIFDYEKGMRRDFEYPSDPEGMLEMLADRGLT